MTTTGPDASTRTARGGTSPYLAAFRDVDAKRPSEGANIDALDGARGLALLLVVVGHAQAFGMTRHGVMGVWLFFTLSAFLLLGPFVADPQRIRRGRALRHYAKRRVQRILPTYYFILLATFVLTQWDLERLVEHLLFLRGDNVFWTIPQEMLFYVILPLIPAAHLWLFRGSLPWTAGALAVLATVANLGLDEKVFAMEGGGTRLRFHLGVFLSGASAAYLVAWPRFRTLLRTPVVSRLLDAAGFVVLLWMFLAAPYFHEHWYGELPGFSSLHPMFAWTYRGTSGVLSALLVVAAVAIPNGALGRLLSWRPLRLLGIVSFSFYLIHMTLILKLTALGMEGGALLFAVALTLGFALACFVYATIERHGTASASDRGTA